MNFDDFVKNSLTEMIHEGIGINLPQKKNIIIEGTHCNGYFAEEPDLEFCCAIGKPSSEWREIFIHEYAHFTQWKTKCKVWRKMTLPSGESVDNVIYQWINGSETYNTDEIKICIDRLRDVEENCERRAVKIIKKYNIDIDKKKYIKKANAYIYFYSVLPIFRKWNVSEKAPYLISEIVDLMPSTFKSNYDEIPYGYVDLVEKYCY